MRVLFVCSVYQFSRETFPVLRRLAESGFEVHVLVGWAGDDADAYEQRCRDAGFTTHRPPPALRYGDPRAAPAPATDDELTRVPSRFGRRLEPPLAVFRLARRYGRDLVAGIDPGLVLGGPYFSCGTFDQGIARASRRRRIPYCCLAVSPYLGERNVIQARFAHHAAGMVDRANLVATSGLGRVLARLAPSWWRERDGIAMFPFGPKRMLGAWLTGLLDPNPWQQPSDRYDVCFVESAFSRDLLVGSGYAVEKVCIVGKPMLDEVFEHLDDGDYSARLYASLGLEPHAPFVLYNVEPGYEHSYRSRDEHWRLFREVSDAVKATAAPVVVSLHPLCAPEDYRFVEDEYGFRLCEDYTIAELYPYCGVSLSFPCSTNLLAEVFEKPLVVFDFEGFTREESPRAPEYRLPGARFAYSGDEVRQELDAALAGAEQASAGPSPAGRTRAAQRVVDELRERFALGARDRAA